MKYTLIIFFLLFASTPAKSQYSITGGLAYNFFIGENSDFISIGSNIVGDYAFNNKNACLLNIEYFLPSSKDFIGNAKANSSSTIPQDVPVKYTHELTLFQISAGYKRYFIGDLEDLFNFYGTASLGVIFAPNNRKIDNSSFNRDNYSITDPIIDPFSINQFDIFGYVTIATGIGTEIAITDDIFLTNEIKFCIPVSSFDVTGDSSDFDLGAQTRINIGIKKILDDVYIFHRTHFLNINGF